MGEREWPRPWAPGFWIPVKSRWKTGARPCAGLDRIDASGLDPRLKDAAVVGATDVTNPLCGPTGASAVYGPQKGATPEVVARLDAALANYAAIVKRDLGKDVLDLPRAGAAGGLGAGLAAFLDADLRSGIDMVCDALGFETSLEGADLVISGEGPGGRFHRVRQSTGWCGPLGTGQGCAHHPADRRVGVGLPGTLQAWGRRSG